MKAPTRTNSDAVHGDIDMTDLAANEALDLFRQIGDNIPSVLWVTSIERDRVFLVTRSFEATWGLPRGRFVADPSVWANSLHPDDRERVLESWSRRMEEGYEETYRIVRGDGEVRWIRDRTFPIRDESGQVRRLASVADDITDKTAAEEALRRSEEQFRQSQKMEAIGQLAGGVAHDFNNVLTAIKGHSQFILHDLDDDHPIRDDVVEITRAADRAADITRQLLAFSRRQITRPEVLDLTTVVRDVGRMLERLIGENIELVMVHHDEEALVLADRGQIEQVLVNLAVNARDAMPEGGRLTLRTRQVDLDRDYTRDHPLVTPGPHILLSVSDTGEGMPAEIQSQIFEPFFTTKTQGRGTGLGLSTVYGIVKQARGFIWLYSEPGEGSTFKIYLPEASGRATAIARTQVPTATSKADGEVVLVVEDEESVRSIMRRTLERHGYRVIAAIDGHAALQALERHDGPVHLVLTDLIMPGMSGKELARAVAELHPDMPILFSSGYAEDEIAHRGLLEPGVNFLEKPFEPRVLAETVRKILEDHA